MTPECRHIKTSGGKCGSPALRGQPYCYFHSRLKERTAASRPRRHLPWHSKISPTLEDRGAIQLAISRDRQGSRRPAASSINVPAFSSTRSRSPPETRKIPSRSSPATPSPKPTRT